MSKTFEAKYPTVGTWNSEEYEFVVVPAFNHNLLEATKAVGKYIGEHVTTQELRVGYVRWHGGIDTEGEIGNRWWLEGKDSEFKKGANKVWYYGEFEL